MQHALVLAKRVENGSKPYNCWGNLQLGGSHMSPLLFDVFLFALPSMTEVVAFPFYFVAFVCDVTQFTKAFPLSMVTGNLV